VTTWLKFDDYATPANADGVRVMAAAGVRVVGRYAGLGGSWKWLTPAERDLLFAAGIGIFPLAEAGGDRALAGFAAGVDDARGARSSWRALGLPDGHPICFAVDFNPTPEQLAGPVTEYFRGISSVEQADYDYGGAATVDWLSRHHLVGGGFQTYAWSGGRWSTFATIKQERNDVPISVGLAVDVGEIESTVPIWLEKPVPPTPPPAHNPTTGDLATVLRDGHSAAEDLVLTQYRAGYVANQAVPAILAALKSIQATLDAMAAALTTISPAAAPVGPTATGEPAAATEPAA